VDPRLVLVITPPDAPPGDEDSRAVVQQAHASGLQVSSVTDDQAVTLLLELTAAGKEPAVVVIGPGLPNNIALARRIRAVWPTGQMLFAPAPAHTEKLRHDLRLAPMIGPNWSLVEISDSDLSQKIKKAALSSQQRLRLRTTLDRANIKLIAPKPVDSLDYRRMVISEHYLANLLEQSQEAIVSLDTRNAVLYWSAGAERLFDRSADAVSNMQVAQLSFWSSALQACLEQIHAGAQTIAIEAKCQLPGGVSDLEISFSRVHDSRRNFIGTSLSFRDVSQRNRLLEAERAARLEAERMSRMKDEFLAILSHELRTPLSAVIGRTQLLQMRYSNEPDLLSALSIIERNAKLQAKLIEDLLDVSSIITGKLCLDMQPIAIRQLIEAAVEAIRPAAENKRIRISTEIHLIADVVQGDSHRLQQVLFNLLSNAVKFTEQDGHVAVRSAQNGNRIEITVSDNGIGIQADFLPSVFERFGQEDASITRRHGGLGLGLSIAKQLVELHGGDIRASSPGRNLGASFTVALPVHHAHYAVPECLPGSATQPAKQDAAALSGRHILVVEDVEDARLLVTEILRNHGAEVVAVESGMAALQALDSFHPDVLVSDIGMPGMDGYELIRKIRIKGFASENLPALALTAFASSADRARAMLAGFQVHLSKPLIVTELVEAVIRLSKSINPRMR